MRYPSVLRASVRAWPLAVRWPKRYRDPQPGLRTALKTGHRRFWTATAAPPSGTTTTVSRASFCSGRPPWTPPGRRRPDQRELQKIFPIPAIRP